MKSFWPEFFYYTSTERRGIVVLAILVILCIVLPLFYPFWVADQDTDFSTFMAEIEAAEQEATASLPASASPALFPFDPNEASKEDFIELGLSPKLSQTIINYRNKGGLFKKKQDFGKIYNLSDADYQRLLPYIRISSNDEKEATKAVQTEKATLIAPFPFDPNTAIETELRQLGFSDKVVKTMLNYRKKGGKFRKKEDLKKIYNLNPEVYNRLEAYIKIEEQTPIDSAAPIAGLVNEREVKVYDAPVLKIDINQATPEEWQQLQGIGPAYSKRITNFREKLGGFYSIDQIAETYGLPDSTFQKIKPQLLLSRILKTIGINKVTAEELKSHPYLTWKQAQVIISYREQHGPYKSADDLRKVRILSEDLIEKLAPYLSFE
ncbi:MAG: hypothetical protein DHS20C18_43660 [Saprospiraceae bacterium]|nr:MAG: hypothetical protein DHS20C18_43660 [Saprospiraceae bacterium]